MGKCVCKCGDIVQLSASYITFRDFFRSCLNVLYWASKAVSIAGGKIISYSWLKAGLHLYRKCSYIGHSVSVAVCSKYSLSVAELQIVRKGGDQ